MPPGCFEDSWNEFIKEGELLFDYMVHNFESFFDRESIIKHFNIRDALYYYTDSEELLAIHGNDIQKELIPWIRKELENKELFKKENWKPFRDQGILTDRYLGYKKMFQYKEYYLQLSIDDYCDLSNNCIYCKHEKKSIHFELALWGWKDEEHEKLQPDNDVIILSDNIMPNYYWDRK